MFRFSQSKNINFAKLYDQAKDLYRDLPPVRRRRKKSILKRLVIVFFVFLLSVLFLIASYAAVNFATVKLIFNEAMVGKERIDFSISALKQGHYSESITAAEKAQASFSIAYEAVESFQTGGLFKIIPWLNQQAENGIIILRAAETLSQAVANAGRFGEGFDTVFNRNLPFSKLAKNEKRAVLKYLYEGIPELIGIKASVDLALIGLEGVDLSSLPWPINQKANYELARLINELDKNNKTLDSAIPLSQLLPQILGYPKKSSYLILLQNSDELRPTGGFIGTYGILETEDGDITRLDTHDVYHMDMPVKDKISEVPPEPIKKYLGVDKWYLRDSNWSPDWPESAQKIEWFFLKENSLLEGKDRINQFSGKFDGVIGITPELITDLINISGPIEYDGELYTKDNFTDLLEYKVEKGYVQLGVPSWHRKEVIGEMVKIIKERLLDGSASVILSVVAGMQKSLEEKDLILYFHDTEIQSLAAKQGWSGAIAPTDDDYLMVVDANMAALKTDKVVNRSISYVVDEGVNGLFSDLTIRYAHIGDFDWRTTRYRTYTRVYVPEGSELISIEGVKEDSFVKYKELGKTVFAYFAVVEPGKIGTVRLRYKLPDRISLATHNGKYSLYVQKQPGKEVDELTVDANLMNSIQSYSPTGFNVYRSSGGRVRWSEDPETDRRYEIIINN